MVETRNGGDREKTISADAAKSMDLQQIQEEMELAKHNYEKLAQRDRVTTKKLDSVEKKIETMVIESTSRFKAIEKQMTHITDVLTRLEESAVFNQRLGKEIASASQPPRDQVPITILNRNYLPHS